jgi:hypothetical protein
MAAASGRGGLGCKHSIQKAGNLISHIDISYTPEKSLSQPARISGRTDIFDIYAGERSDFGQ